MTRGLDICFWKKCRTHNSGTLTQLNQKDSSLSTDRSVVFETPCISVQNLASGEWTVEKCYKYTDTPVQLVKVWISHSGILVCVCGRYWSWWWILHNYICGVSWDIWGTVCVWHLVICEFFSTSCICDLWLGMQSTCYWNTIFKRAGLHAYTGTPIWTWELHLQ